MAVGTTIMDYENMVNGAYGEAYVTIHDEEKGDLRYNLFNLINFESSVSVNMKERGVLGRTGKISYPTGWKGTWKADLSMCSPIFRELILQFKAKGKFPSFDIQVTNENTGGTIGRQTILHTGCYIDSIILAKLDVDSDDTLNESISGTFNDFEMPEKFGLMAGHKE